MVKYRLDLTTEEGIVRHSCQFTNKRALENHINQLKGDTYLRLLSYKKVGKIFEFVKEH